VTNPRRLTARLYAVAAGAYAADRLTKVWAVHALADRPPVKIIPRVLDLRYTTNSGGAFGLGQSASWLFAGATILISAAIVVASLRPLRPLASIALGLVLGGALGNLTDRVLRGDGVLSGRVVDFIDIHVWPVFNVADSAIVIGALLLIVASFGHQEG
jgi:signal peptidase II